MKDELLYCPLGGAGEIGMNMNLFGYGQEDDHKWIMVDVGVTFADDSIPGVDLIYPDPGYAEDKKDNFLGIILTHAQNLNVRFMLHLLQLHSLLKNSEKKRLISHLIYKLCS